MGLFTQPPAPPQDYLNLDLFLKEQGEEAPVKKFRRTLAAEWFPQSGIQITWPHSGTDWAPMLEEVTECYIRLAYEIAIRESLLIVAPETGGIRSLLESRLPRRASGQTATGRRGRKCPLPAEGSGAAGKTYPCRGTYGRADSLPPRRD